MLNVCSDRDYIVPLNTKYAAQNSVIYAVILTQLTNLYYKERNSQTTSIVFVVSVCQCISVPRLWTYPRRRGKIPRVSWPPSFARERGKRYFSSFSPFSRSFLPYRGLRLRRYISRNLSARCVFPHVPPSGACFIRVMATRRRRPYPRHRTAVYVRSLDVLIITIKYNTFRRRPVMA